MHFLIMNLPNPNIMWDLTLLHYFKFVFQILHSFTSNLQNYVYTGFVAFLFNFTYFNFTLILHQNFYVVAEQRLAETWLAERTSQKEILYRTFHESSCIISNFPSCPSSNSWRLAKFNGDPFCLYLYINLDLH